MKIMICGSMTFAKEMLEAKKKLEKLGHEAFVPCDAEVHVNAPQFVDDLEADRKFCIETDIMRQCMDLIANADAMIVLNYAKNGLPGYVGTSSLMELGLAHYLRKKIFLLNDIPSPEQVRWAHEVLIFQPTVINGDFTKVQ